MKNQTFKDVIKTVDKNLKKAVIGIPVKRV